MVASEKKFIIFAHHQEMMDSVEETICAVRWYCNAWIQ
jgi:hypothetical protein